MVKDILTAAVSVVAFAVLRKVDRGEVRLEQEVTISQSNADAECALGCARYGFGRSILVSTLLNDMIVHSNNIATNQLIDLVGKPFINRTAMAVDARGIQVLRKVYVQVNPEPELTVRNQGNAAAFVAFYREVVSNSRELLTASSREKLLDLLARCHSRNRLNALLPRAVTFFHKTGSTSDSSSDAGFYWLDPEHVVIIAGMHDFHDYAPLRQVGRAVFDRLGD